MDVYEALYTTRAMRRVESTRIPEDVQKRILDAAIRAPSGGNMQGWRFVLLDDRQVIGKLGAIYRDCMTQLWQTVYRERMGAARAHPEAAESRDFERLYRSAEWLAEHFAEVPLVLLGFIQHDTSGGSIYPATWSAQLAARAEGVGSTLTSVFALRADDVLEAIGVPEQEGWVFVNCVTFGYPKGRWGVAPRRPVHEVAYRNAWGQPLGFEIDEPIWPR